MRSLTKTSTGYSAVWKPTIQFRGSLSASAARSILNFGFSTHDHERMHELSAKARAGTITLAEKAQMETFERLGCVLDILHSQARKSLTAGK